MEVSNGLLTTNPNRRLALRLFIALPNKRIYFRQEMDSLINLIRKKNVFKK